MATKKASKKAGKKAPPRGQAVPVDIRLPDKTFRMLNTIVDTGYLGSTMSDVVSHILRESLFQSWLRALAQVPVADEVSEDAKASPIRR